MPVLPVVPPIVSAPIVLPVVPDIVLPVVPVSPVVPLMLPDVVPFVRLRALVPRCVRVVVVERVLVEGLA
ncbi:hypothetical protein HMP09_3080 [Sphingomonas sp. HMP9]|nr:hypothetical protein HMP09_3080 [Sphingomonas sp. HMP9]